MVRKSVEADSEVLDTLHQVLLKLEARSWSQPVITTGDSAVDPQRSRHRQGVVSGDPL